MRGDLVYEKLGEIDLDLVAEAMYPKASPVIPELYDLKRGREPVYRPQRKKLRRVLLICAILILATLFVVGSGVILSLSGVFDLILPTTDPPIEVETDDPDARYKGEVTICHPPYGETILIGGSRQMDALAMDIKKILNSIGEYESSEPTYTAGDYILHVGDTEIWLTVNGDGYLFMKDRATGEEWSLDEETARELDELIQTVYESRSGILSFAYEYDTLRHGDDFVFSVAWWEGYGSIYKIDKVYLRYDGEDTEYVTPGFFTVEDQTTYRIRIKDDAPYGKYTLVAHVYSPYTGRNIEMEIPSVQGAVEILPGEPTYTFTESMTHEIYNYGDTIFVNAVMTNNGDPILRWTIDPSILPEVSLRSVTNGKTYPMIREQESDLPGRVIKLNSGESSVGIFYLEFTSSMPTGVYDLVMTFEDHTQVFENAVAVMDPDKDCYYNMAFTITDTGDERTLKLYVTLRGKDVYRYGSSTCFAPDSVFLICEDDNTTGMIDPELTAVNDGPIVEDGLRIRHWKEGESMIFTYTFQIDLEDEINGTIPGVHDLVVHYKGEESVIYEDALTVVAP